MPGPHPPEFRRRAVELARLREKSIRKIAEELGISESCLRNLSAQADINDGRREGLTSDKRAELVRLRREKRVLEMEVEILKRASPISLGRTSSQNDLHLHRRMLLGPAGRAVLSVMKVSRSGFFAWGPGAVESDAEEACRREAW